MAGIPANAIQELNYCLLYSGISGICDKNNIKNKLGGWNCGENKTTLFWYDCYPTFLLKYVLYKQSVA